jgi:cardiolipin synthase
MVQPVLHPLPGRRLPKALRAGRVWRLAEALPEGLSDPALPELLTRIETGEFFGGNVVRVYTDGGDAFAAMCTEMLGAKTEVLVESYIFKDDSVGLGFRDTLVALARRGVAVRVLADAFGSGRTSAAFWQPLESAGAEFRLFHPWYKGLLNAAVRDHRKIVVVDRAVAFTGGMNIGEEYGSSLRQSGGKAWRDTHSRVEGPSAWEMAVVFSEGWARAGGTPFTIDPIERPGSAPDHVLLLDSRPGRGHEETAAVIAAVVAASRRRVWITNAYFAPGRRAVESLCRAAQRGVDVRLLLPGKSDVPLVRHAAHGHYDDLLQGGVRVFEYEAAILHAKTMVADGLVGIVGSSNLDFRSFRFNAECNLCVISPQTGAALEAAFEEDLKRSVEIHATLWRGRAWRHRIGDAGAKLLSPFL